MEKNEKLIGLLDRIVQLGNKLSGKAEKVEMQEIPTENGAILVTEGPIEIGVKIHARNEDGTDSVLIDGDYKVTIPDVGVKELQVMNGEIVGIEDEAVMEEEEKPIEEPVASTVEMQDFIEKIMVTMEAMSMNIARIDTIEATISKMEKASIEMSERVDKFAKAPAKPTTNTKIITAPVNGRIMSVAEQIRFEELTKINNN